MAKKQRRKKRLWDSYRLGNFRPSSEVRGIFGDPKARVITLTRRSKKQFAAYAVRFTAVGMTSGGGAFGIFRAPTRGYTWSSTFGG